MEKCFQVLGLQSTNVKILSACFRPTGIACSKLPCCTQTCYSPSIPCKDKLSSRLVSELEHFWFQCLQMVLPADHVRDVSCRLPILCVPIRCGGMYATLEVLFPRLKLSPRCSACVRLPMRRPIKRGGTPILAEMLLEVAKAFRVAVASKLVDLWSTAI